MFKTNELKEAAGLPTIPNVSDNSESLAAAFYDEELTAERIMAVSNQVIDQERVVLDPGVAAAIIPFLIEQKVTLDVKDHRGVTHTIGEEFFTAFCLLMEQFTAVLGQLEQLRGMIAMARMMQEASNDGPPQIELP